MVTCLLMFSPSLIADLEIFNIANVPCETAVLRLPRLMPKKCALLKISAGQKSPGSSDFSLIL